MNTRISLVRHGVTDWNYAGRVQGRSDIPLAPEGERQTAATAERLTTESWDAVYSSPLQRAYQTALAIARRMTTANSPGPPLWSRSFGAPLPSSLPGWMRDW
jgi:2,3-bisphosphoglycerate-dependent phosphoglycerate mutase